MVTGDRDRDKPAWAAVYRPPQSITHAMIGRARAVSSRQIVRV
jgi:hypothetical protein